MVRVACSVFVLKFRIGEAKQIAFPRCIDDSRSPASRRKYRPSYTYVVQEVSILCTIVCCMNAFSIKCGHYVKVRVVESSVTSQEPKWELRIFGPKIKYQCGYKILYSDANESAVSVAAADFLGVVLLDLRKPPSRPQLLVGLDVETSDWDEQIAFAKQSDHFKAGFPCREDHTSCTGYICALGYCVFERTSDEGCTYRAGKPVSSIIKLPESANIAKKAFAFHGISDAACLNGEDFFKTLTPIIVLLKQGAQICCHNLAHETLVFCRELQKRVLGESSSFTEQDALLLMRCLYEGHCTLDLAKRGNDGYFRGLTDEYQRVFAPSSETGDAHEPGQDAYKCARLFLHFNQATLVADFDGQMLPETKKAKTKTAQLSAAG